MESPFTLLPREIEAIIVNRAVTDETSYVAVTLVCHGWWNAIDHIAAEHKYANHLKILLRIFPDREWNYIQLSQNPNITWEFIRDNPQIPWSFEHVSQNPNVTWEIFINNLDRQWSYSALSRNERICQDLVALYPDREWCDGRRMRPFIIQPPRTEDATHTIKPSKIPDIEWRHIPTIDTDAKNVYDTTIDGLTSYQLYQWYLSRTAPINVILANPDKPWNYTTISAREIVTPQVVVSNPQIPWHARLLASNPNFMVDELIPDPDRYDPSQVSMNPNVTPEIVAANPDYSWSYVMMSNNPSVTWRFVRDNIDQQWNFAVMSQNLFRHYRVMT